MRQRKKDSSGFIELHVYEVQISWAKVMVSGDE